MYRIISIFFLIGFPFFLYSQQSPKLPVEPTSPQVDGAERDSRGEKKSESTLVLKEVIVSFCDGRKLKGKWEGKEKEIQFHHIREGIRYKKNILTKDLSSIKIQTWKAILHKQEKNGVAYKMVPSLVSIKLKSGDVFDKDMGLDGTEYSVMKVENENGMATVYSMWMDLLYKDGAWFSKLDKISPDKERSDCHKDVIREIQFL